MASIETERGSRRPLPGVDFPFLPAPMVGLSHCAFREVIRSYRPAGVRSLAFTEMLSSRRLPAERLGARPETSFDPDEGDLVPQIAAGDEERVARAIERLAPMRPVAIDLNLGCPVAHAFEREWGVALMDDPRRAERVVRASLAAARVPVSAKIRTGLRDDPAHLVDFARMLEQAGVSWITLHPRVAGARRRGRARWEYIALVRDAVSVPVVGNGDVQTADDAFDLLRRTGCDAVMIGRAALARPWIFWQIGERLGLGPPEARAGERAPREREEEGREAGRALAALAEAAARRFPPEAALKRIRFHVEWASRWLPFGHELWRRLMRAGDPIAARAEIDRFFARPQAMSARTSLLH